MLLYLLAIRTVALSMTHLFSSRHLSAGFTGVCVTSMALVSGYIIHSEEVGYWASWLKYASPQWWMNQPIVQNELSPVEHFRCTGNPVVTTDIIKQVPCGLPSGPEAVKYFDFLPKFAASNEASIWFSPTLVPVLITVSFYALFQLLDIVFFLGRRQVSKQSRAKQHKL